MVKNFLVFWLSRLDCAALGSFGFGLFWPLHSVCFGAALAQAAFHIYFCTDVKTLKTPTPPNGQKFLRFFEAAKSAAASGSRFCDEASPLLTSARQPRCREANRQRLAASPTPALLLSKVLKSSRRILGSEGLRCD